MAAHACDALLCTVSVNVRSNTLCTAPPRTTMHIDILCIMSKQGNMSYTPHATCAPTYGARRQHKLASHAHAHYNARPRPCVLMHNVRTHARARNAHYQRRPRLLRLRRLPLLLTETRGLRVSGCILPAFTFSTVLCRSLLFVQDCMCAHVSAIGGWFRASVTRFDTTRVCVCVCVCALCVFV